MIVYSNGRYHPLEEPAAALGNSGFLHGRGVFTTLRLDAGRPVALPAHHARLVDHGGDLSLTLPLVYAELVHVISDLVEANALQNKQMRIRITLTSEDGHPFLSAVPGSLPADLPGWQRDGMEVVTLGPAHQRTVLPRLKTVSFLASLLALEAAAAAGAGEALILDRTDHLLEGAVSNVFLVRDGTLATPADDGQILAGITRGRVLELARGAGQEVRETTLTGAELRQADEIFLTNCVRGIVPVTRVDGRPCGRDRVGPVTRELQRALTRADASA